jgi:glycosyltransferase involved in cell wall biosynthesis
MHRPHVLLVHDSYMDYVTCLANALAERVPVTVVHSSHMHSLMPALSEDVRTVVYPYRRMRDPRRVRHIPVVGDVAASVGADLVHFQQSVDPWFNLTQIRGRRRLPEVMTVHDIAPHPGDRTSVPGGHLTLRIHRRRMERFITHTSPLRDELVRRWRIRAESVDVVPHGELGGLYRRLAGHPTGSDPSGGGMRRLNVLFFGRVWPYKGLDRLVEAMNVLADTRPGLILTIAGEGQDLDTYLKAVRGPLGVRVLNRYVDHDEVAALFGEADVVCLPYLEASQSGVHALACGLGVPVVASAVGGLASAVRDGRDGLLVPPGDVTALTAALARVLDDPALRAQLSSGATARAAGDLHWGTIADATLEVYARSRHSTPSA